MHKIENFYDNIYTRSQYWYKSVERSAHPPIVALLLEDESVIVIDVRHLSLEMEEMMRVHKKILRDSDEFTDKEPVAVALIAEAFTQDSVKKKARRKKILMIHILSVNDDEALMLCNITAARNLTKAPFNIISTGKKVLH